MAKIGQPGPQVTADGRADSTLDAIVAAQLDPGAALAAIAGEEIAENEAVAAAIEAQQQAEADAIMAELVEGWQTAMRHAADVVTSAADGLKPVWTNDRMDAIGAALARCDAHYGWGGAGKLLGHPVVAVAVASAPVVIGTIKWAQVEKAKALLRAKEYQAAKAAGGIVQAPGKDAKPAGAVDIAGRMDEHLAAA